MLFKNNAMSGRHTGSVLPPADLNELLDVRDFGRHGGGRKTGLYRTDRETDDRRSLDVALVSLDGTYGSRAWNRCVGCGIRV